MKPLVVIPARGGSKGIPRKNIKLLGGKPLIQYTIEAARKVFDDEIICVSTDDVEIKNVVESLGLAVHFLRPANLATDKAGTHEVLLHAIEYYKNKFNYDADLLVLLQPTSPFRTEQHIKEALALFEDDCEMVVSVKESKANPYFTLREESNAGWLIKSKEGSFTRRQDCPKVYELNGAIYIISVRILKIKNINEFTKIKKYLMENIFSHDVDTPLDWTIAELIEKELQHRTSSI